MQETKRSYIKWEKNSEFFFKKLKQKKSMAEMDYLLFDLIGLILKDWL